MKYHVHGIIHTSKYLGEVEAESEEEAKEKAYEELNEKMYVSVCHQCSRQFSDTPEISDLEVEPA